MKETIRRADMSGTIADRLKLCLKEKDLTAKELSDMAKIPPATISTILNNKVKDIKADTLFKMSVVLGVSASWLYKGVEESEYKAYNEINKDEYTSINLYKVNFGAGAQPTPTYEEEHDITPLLIPTKFFIDSRASIKDCKAFRVLGDSMTPAIKENDTIIVNCADNEVIHDGGCYAFVDSFNLLRVKILRQRLDKSIVIHSINDTKYEDEIISGEDLNKIQLVGRVIGCFNSI